MCSASLPLDPVHRTILARPPREWNRPRRGCHRNRVQGSECRPGSVAPLWGLSRVEARESGALHTRRLRRPRSDRPCSRRRHRGSTGQRRDRRTIVSCNAPPAYAHARTSTANLERRIPGQSRPASDSRSARRPRNGLTANHQPAPPTASVTRVRRCRVATKDTIRQTTPPAIMNSATLSQRRTDFNSIQVLHLLWWVGRHPKLNHRAGWEDFASEAA